MQLANKVFKDYRKLARFLMDGAVFTAFDTETTGLSAEKDRIIEIGAVQFNSDGILGRFNTLINPQIPIPSFITSLTHISNKMIEEAPLIGNILKDFQQFLGDSIIVGHNVQFDIRFLHAEEKRCGLKESMNMFIDTLGLCRWAYPELGKYKQEEMAKMLGIKAENAHRAWEDAFVCGNIFLHTIRKTAARQKI